MVSWYLVLLLSTLSSTAIVSGETFESNDLLRVVNSLQNQLHQLEEKSQNQLRQLEEKSFNQLQQVEQKSKETIENLKGEIASLNTKVAAHEKKIGELEFTVTNADHIKRQFHTDASDIESDLKRSKIDVFAGKDIGPGRLLSPRQVETRIAFHVQLSANKVIGKGTNVVYDTELLDIGNGYTPGNGIYTVPTTGLYVMTWTTNTDFHSYYRTNLVVNGAPRGSSDADSRDVYAIHTATGVTVMSLNVNDIVFIRVHDKNGTMVSQPYAHGASTFSGWMLK